MADRPPSGGSTPPDTKLILQNARSAIEAAQEVIGQCDCITAEDARRDPKRAWREARDAYFASVRAPAPVSGTT